MRQDTPHHGDRPSPIDHRQAHDTGGIPPHRGIQRHLQPFATPAHQGLLHEWTIQRRHLDRLVIEPAPKAAHGALALLSATAHKRGPGAEADRGRVDEAHHHPGQRFAMTKVEPMGMLAEHLHQRLIKIGRVLHEEPPRDKQASILSYWGDIVTRYGFMNEHVFTFVSQPGWRTLFLVLNSRIEGSRK